MLLDGMGGRSHEGLRLKGLKILAPGMSLSLMEQCQCPTETQLLVCGGFGFCLER